MKDKKLSIKKILNFDIFVNALRKAFFSEIFKKY